MTHQLRYQTTISRCIKAAVAKRFWLIMPRTSGAPWKALISQCTDAFHTLPTSGGGTRGRETSPSAFATSNPACREVNLFSIVSCCILSSSTYNTPLGVASSRRCKPSCHGGSPLAVTTAIAPNRADVIVKQKEPLKDILGKPAKLSQSTVSLLYAVSHYRRSPVAMTTLARL